MGEATNIPDESSPSGGREPLPTVAPILTHREVSVLEFLAEGLSSRQVAKTLGVTDQAVTYHVGNLLSKFACGNRAGLVARAYFLGHLNADVWPPKVQTVALVRQRPTSQGRH
jgi:DNA-binding NarL/FixJ family response regulator